jgi:hypothetical protein
VLACRAVSEHVGEVTLRHVGVKNVRPQALLDAGAALFEAERTKPAEARVAEKVVELTRQVLVRRRPA